MTFAGKLSELLAASDLPITEQAAVLRAMADAVEEAGGPVVCHIVPFVPGRRPTDEDAHPGLGSSDEAALVTGAVGVDGPENMTRLLFELDRLPAGASVEATVALAGPDRSDEPRALAGWSPRPVDTAARVPGRRLALDIHPEHDLAAAELGFPVRFLEQARVELRVVFRGVPVAADEAWLDVCDIRLLGSLYQRIVDRLVVPDTARQAAEAGVPDPGAAYHPWYPVLRIGMDKAALYTAALVGDIVGKQQHLTDPAWLLRLGVYLELLTCLGIVEAVRDEPGVGDLLTPEERAAFDASPVYKEIRRRIDPEAWREVWGLRRITFPGLSAPRTGPVSARNLLTKKRATMRFLHVHHEDLKHAIELAGPNRHNAQETWHRVFRDAERAVLRQTAAAFPELAFLPGPVRELVLWQRRSIADQQGLYATACVQYRASMNSVADWAKARGLMDHAGAECITREVSLLEAHSQNPDRVAALQRRDGYGPRLDVTEPAEAVAPTTAEVEALLATVPILRMLSADDIHGLAETARPLLLGPTERLVVQGEEGNSLFLVADGSVEVLLGQADGSEVSIEVMDQGEVVGEMALLTGERRGATVRAVDGAVVYEIGHQQYEPLLRAHPEWVDELATVMEERLARRAVRLADVGVAGAGRAHLRDRIRRRFFG